MCAPWQPTASADVVDAQLGSLARKFAHLVTRHLVRIEFVGKVFESGEERHVRGTAIGHRLGDDVTTDGLAHFLDDGQRVGRILPAVDANDIGAGIFEHLCRLPGSLAFRRFRIAEAKRGHHGQIRFPRALQSDQGVVSGCLAGDEHGGAVDVGQFSGVADLGEFVLAGVERQQVAAITQDDAFAQFI